jgi:BirA family transcriptional regulator, biotin operon repressor / biotin---[acetyl-CoA-carboxylase] ligase
VAVPLPDGVGLHRALIAALADGEARSAAELARVLGQPEAEVQAAAAELRALGVGIAEARRGEDRRGFRLAAPVELLDAARIREALDPAVRDRIAQLAILFAIDSTNTWLLARPPPPSGCADAVFAELQLAGRGRHGRAWATPFGGSVALSLGWTFRDAARVDPTLSLAVGVAVARALVRQGARGVGLKWPNDVWFEDRKMGGILVELKTAAGGAGQVVIGVGLNLSLSADMRRAIEAGGVRIAALADACPAPPARNTLAAALVTALLSMLESFERWGFAAFRDEWTSLDALAGRPARILVGDDTVEGIARGVDTDGALLVDSGGQLRRFVCGEASLRLHREDT